VRWKTFTQCNEQFAAQHYPYFLLIYLALCLDFWITSVVRHIMDKFVVKRPKLNANGIFLSSTLA